MKNAVKRTLALALCVLMFAALLPTAAFAKGKSDAFFKWYEKAHENYANSLIKQPKTWEDYKTNSQLKWAFLVDFNNHKGAAMLDVAKEANQIDEATYYLLVAAQKLKEEEAIKLAAEEKAARDKAVADTEKARADAWAAAVAGMPGDEAYKQFQNEGQQAVKDAEKKIDEAKSDYDAAAGLIDDAEEQLRKERERKLKELMEEMARLQAAQANVA